MIQSLDDKRAVALPTVLAQEHRLKIFRLLAWRGSSERQAGEIGISPTSTSFHLKELERTGLLRSTCEGRFIRYAVNIEAMRQLLGFCRKIAAKGIRKFAEASSWAAGVCVILEERWHERARL